jgi:flagellar biosynthesis protein FliQ
MRRANVAFFVIFAGFTFLHLYRMASISPTWDEGTDIAIVQCLATTHSPFACLDDISQTRLPYFIHAFVSSSIKAQYVISFVASALTLLMLYAFARREFGVGVATMTASLYTTSPQLLASGRMLMTHSNILFTMFTTASFIAFYRSAGGSPAGPPPARRHYGWLILSAIAFGLATSCSIVGVFNGIVIAIFYALTRRFAWRDLMFIPIAIATFFATSIIYLKPALLMKLIRACMLSNIYPFWNYLNLGSPHAPWYFSLVVFIIKIGPWWLVLAAACYATTLHRPRRLQTAFLASLAIALLINFALKGFVFHYDAPHHQVQFYPLVCLFLAAVILEHRLTKPLVAAIALCFAIQLYDVIRFFPNYLFYGAQYGDRFIGEFYGPAVMHGQDRGPVNSYIDTLIARDPNVKILVADHNALERPEPNFVAFTKRDPAVRYPYAFVDRLYGVHFRFPERDAYNAYLAANYREEYTYSFPTRVWMYRLLKLNPAERSARQDLAHDD